MIRNWITKDPVFVSLEEIWNLDRRHFDQLKIFSSPKGQFGNAVGALIFLSWDVANDPVVLLRKDATYSPNKSSVRGLRSTLMNCFDGL